LPVLLVEACQGRDREELIVASGVHERHPIARVLIPAKAAGLPKDSVANVSHVITVDRDFLTEPAGRLRLPAV